MRLHLSARNPTGYLGVSKVFNGSRQWTGTFGATYAKQYLGTYDTAVEAAAYARHMQSQGMPVEAEAMEEGDEPAPPAALGRAERFAPAAMNKEVVAEHDGVALHLSESSVTGYKGVKFAASGRYIATYATQHIGTFDTAVEDGARRARLRHIGLRTSRRLNARAPRRRRRGRALPSSRLPRAAAGAQSGPRRQPRRA